MTLQTRGFCMTESLKKKNQNKLFLYLSYFLLSPIQRVFTLLIPLNSENRSLCLKPSTLTHFIVFSYCKSLVVKVVSLTSKGHSYDYSPFM